MKTTAKYISVIVTILVLIVSLSSSVGGYQNEIDTNTNTIKCNSTAIATLRTNVYIKFEANEAKHLQYQKEIMLEMKNLNIALNKLVTANEVNATKINFIKATVERLEK